MMAERRSGALQGAEVPARRPVARRARDDGHRRAVAAAHLLYGRRQRRRVQDDRRRRELGADHRRQGPARIDGCDRRRGLRSEHHLSRHRIRRRAQQRLDRPRRLQDRPTPARRGRSPASTTPARSAPCAFIPPIPTSSGSSAIGDIFKPNAERGVFKTTDGGKTWKKVLFSRTASARWTSSCSRATRTSSTRGCRASSASRGRSSAARRRAASTRAPTAASTSRRSRPACPAI